MEEVKEQLGNLREEKAPGSDDMQLRILMEVAEQVSEMLMDIFNSSLDWRFVRIVVLEDWRVANVANHYLRKDPEKNWETIDLLA